MGVAVVLILAACGVPSEPGSGLTPSGARPINARLSAQLGAEPFAASLVTVDRSGGTLFISGSDGEARAVWFTMPDAGVGEYRIMPGVPVAAGVRIAGQYYVASQGTGSGAIVLTDISRQHLVGRFAFELPGSGEALTVTGGQFTVTF